MSEEIELRELIEDEWGFCASLTQLSHGMSVESTNRMLADCKRYMRHLETLEVYHKIDASIRARSIIARGTERHFHDFERYYRNLGDSLLSGVEDSEALESWRALDSIALCWLIGLRIALEFDDPDPRARLHALIMQAALYLCSQQHDLCLIADDRLRMTVAYVHFRMIAECMKRIDAGDIGKN